MCLPSLTAPHLNFSILCVSSVEFQMENLRIYSENLGDFTLLFYRGRLRNVQSFRTELLFSSLDLLFCLILDAVAVAVCLRSLIE